MSSHMERPRHGSAARYRQIAQTLSRHGLGLLAAQLGMGRLLPPHARRGAPARGTVRGTQAERLRMAVEELGTTYIKLGQILSTRADLLPPVVAAELAKLQDEVPAEPPEAIEEMIRRELGQDSSAVFARLDPLPLGSASIGQVHAARLVTGEEVAVKVQRPGAEERAEEDLAVLRDLARFAQANTTWGGVTNLPALVEDFAETLRGEMDYVREARNAERIACSFARDPSVHVPSIYWQYTTRRVLTMERIRGIKITDAEGLLAAGVDLHQLSACALRAALKMVLEDGFFHADPHPGNFVVEAGQVIGLLDFGMVGELDERTRLNLLYLLQAVVERDAERVVDQMLILGLASPTMHAESLRQEVERLLPPCGKAGSASDVDLRRFLDGLMAMAYRRRLAVPNSLVLMSKTVVMQEALARRFDPAFNLVEVLRPFTRRLAMRIHLEQVRMGRLAPYLRDLGQLALSLPRRVQRLLLQAERGEITFLIRIAETEQAIGALNEMVNRLALAVVVTGLLIGVALLLQSYRSTVLQWLMGALLVVGVAGAVGLGVRVIRGVFHRRH